MRGSKLLAKLNNATTGWTTFDRTCIGRATRVATLSGFVSARRLGTSSPSTTAKNVTTNTMITVAANSL